MSIDIQRGRPIPLHNCLRCHVVTLLLHSGNSLTAEHTGNLRTLETRENTFHKRVILLLAAEYHVHIHCKASQAYQY